MAKKDSYWFRHDSTAGRAIKMRKMAHIYGHWGKGVYWDVVEILRDQEGYSFESDESSLQMLADLIGCKDHARFISWFNDSLRLGLLLGYDSVFHCPPLTENMQVWETKKSNGSKGGRRPKNRNVTEIETEIETELKANQNHKITEQNRTEDKTTNPSFDPHTIDQFIDYPELLKYFNSRTGRNEMRVTSTVKGNVKARLWEMVSEQGLTIDRAKEMITAAIKNAASDQWTKEKNLTLVWITSEDAFYKWATTPPKQTRKAPASV